MYYGEICLFHDFDMIILLPYLKNKMLWDFVNYRMLSLACQATYCIEKSNHSKNLQI